MKYDYRDVANFWHERDKMCEIIEGCVNCPLVHCCAIQDKPTLEQIDIVLKWSAENKAETILEHFNKLFPNAPHYHKDGMPRCCPKDLGWGEDLYCDNFSEGIAHCGDCWNSLYKETKNYNHAAKRWDTAHQEGTMLERFMKLCPNATYHTVKQPEVCPKDLGWVGKDDPCAANCVACWHKPYVESDEKNKD